MNDNITLGHRQKIFCNNCSLPTWHALISVHDQKYEDFVDAEEKLYIEILGRWVLWQCSGCDMIVLCVSWYETPPYEPYKVDYYPPLKTEHGLDKKAYLKILELTQEPS